MPLGQIARARLTLRNTGSSRVDGRWTSDRAIGVEPPSFTLEPGEETHASVSLASFTAGPKRGRARCTASDCVLEVEVVAVVEGALAPLDPTPLTGHALLAAHLANPNSEEVARALLGGYLSRDRLRRSLKPGAWQVISANDERVDDFARFAIHYVRPRLANHAAKIESFDAWIRTVTGTAAQDYLRRLERAKKRETAASQLTARDAEGTDFLDARPENAPPTAGDAEVEATLGRLRRRARATASARDWLTFRLYEAFDRPVTAEELDAAGLSSATLQLELDRIAPDERGPGLPVSAICSLLKHPSTASVHTAKRRAAKTLEAEYRLHAHLRRLAVLVRGLPLGAKGPRTVSPPEWLLFRMAYSDELGSPGADELGTVDPSTLSPDPRACARALGLRDGAFRSVQLRLADEAEWLSNLADLRRDRASLMDGLALLPWTTLAATYAPELGPLPVDELHRARPDRASRAEHDRRALAELERKEEGLDAARLATLLDLEQATLVAHLLYAKPEVHKAMQRKPVSEDAS